jgi:hypothetical protein
LGYRDLARIVGKVPDPVLFLLVEGAIARAGEDYQTNSGQAAENHPSEAALHVFSIKEAVIFSRS